MIKNPEIQHITLDILFSRIEPDDVNDLKNAFSKLKYALFLQNFGKIKYFTKIFVLKMNQQDLKEQEILVEMIELIIKSRIFKKQKELKSIKDKEFLSWKPDLQKEIIRDQMGFFKGRFTEKEKIVDYLYQIQDSKGQAFQQKLLQEILLKLDLNDFYPKRLISQLGKILHDNHMQISDLNKLKNTEK